MYITLCSHMNDVMQRMLSADVKSDISIFYFCVIFFYVSHFMCLLRSQFIFHNVQ